MYQIFLKGDLGQGENEINESYISEQLNLAEKQDLEITINTAGGCVDTAFKIYDLLESYKKLNKAVITTITDEMCASAGVILLLAGNRRIVNKNTEPFIHNAYLSFESGATASANELINAGFELEEINYKIATLYAQKTALDYDTARELMGYETFFTPDEAYQIGLATELSKVYNKLEPKTTKLIIQNKLENKKESKTNINNMTKEEKSFFEVVKNFFTASKTEVKNKIVLTSADLEIDFIDLDSDTEPSVGDKANIDGKPADGEYTVKDGTTYKFDNGVLTEIEVAETVEDEVENVDEIQKELNLANETIETQNKTISDLTEQVNKLTSSLNEATEKVNKFNELESEFQKFTQKENLKTETKNKSEEVDFTDINSNLSKMRKK